MELIRYSKILIVFSIHSAFCKQVLDEILHEVCLFQVVPSASILAVLGQDLKKEMEQTLISVGGLILKLIGSYTLASPVYLLFWCFILLTTLAYFTKGSGGGGGLYFV